MSSDRQRLVESLFLEAAELPLPTRNEFLASRCGDDVDLKREVESLLGAHDGGVGLLDEPQPMTIGLMQQLSGLLKVDDAAIPPSGKIGAYKVIRVLGSGGMGVVYLAEQERPKRTVALKVIRRGLATPSLLRRFEHEAEILGRLHHPGIAQIYEAGVADDGVGPQPYIAMEYIDGQVLTEHAEMHRLGIREKLVLMARVCEAIQHAHQRGVIHRDLKPGNILVQREETHTGDTTGVTGSGTGTGTTLGLSGLGATVGQPKILDFGVARMTEDRGAHAVTTMGTNVGQLIGTLAYMSPEQLSSDGRAEVDTRSDVYAVGVVLFQLLTGKLPYDVSRCALPEAVRRIKEDTPLRLSAFSREFRGDLETIVAKAIEKDKHRRYQSAAELGADLHRFLVGEPISAKRDSALYVLRKQMLRYKSVVGAAAIGVIALVAFAVYAAVSAERFKALAISESLASRTAHQERERADTNARRLQQELFVSSIERGRLEGATGKIVVAEELLWSEYFRDKDSPHAYWALWEVYERNPCRWTVQGPDRSWCAAVSVPVSIVAVGGLNEVRFISAETGALVSELKGLPGTPMAIAFDPQGEHVLIGMNNRNACVARVDQAQPPIYLADPARAHDASVRSAAWSPDGRWLATGASDRRIKLWDAASLEVVAEWEAHTDQVGALAFDPTSTRLASGSFESGPDARIREWTVPAGYPRAEYSPSDSIILDLAYSPDGKLLAAAGYDRFTLLIDTPTRATRVLPGKFSGAGSSVVFSPDGRRLLASGGGECRVWFVESVSELITVGQHRDQTQTAAWIAPGRAVSVSVDGAVKSWDTRRALAMRGAGRFASWCFGTAYSSDGATLAIASGDGTVVIADGATRQRKHVVHTGEDLRTRPVRFLPGDEKLLAGSADGLVRVIDISSGAIDRSFGAARAEIFDVALHPGGRIIATGHADRTARIWDLDTGELLHELKDPRITDRVEGVDFSPDGKLLVCSGLASGVLLFDTLNWVPIATLPGSAHAWTVRFSPDGKHIAAGTWRDNVDIWEVGTRLQVGTLTGHRGLISTIAFSRDGAYIATGGDDATVKLWHFKSRRCVLTIDTYHGEATGLSFHPSGTRLTTGCQDHAAPTWDLTAIDPHIKGNIEYQRARFNAAQTRLAK